MEPLATIRHPVTVRIRKTILLQLVKVAREQGLRLGPFLSHVSEAVALCPSDRFHAALAAFEQEARRR